MAKKREIIVGDHALIRYIERVQGIDLDPIRAEIRSKCEEPINAGAVAILVDGWEYRLSPADRSVITVLKRGAKK